MPYQSQKLSGNSKVQYQEVPDDSGNLCEVTISGNYTDIFQKDRVWLKKEWRLKEEVVNKILGKYENKEYRESFIKFATNELASKIERLKLRMFGPLEFEPQFIQIKYSVENIPEDGVSPTEAHNNTFKHMSAPPQVARGTSDVILYKVTYDKLLIPHN